MTISTIKIGDYLMDTIDHELSDGTTGNVDVGGIEINIPIDHVLDYDDFVSKIQKDKRFEEMMTARTVDRLSGGSKFGKYRNSWSK